jgi:N-methylhydantoinase A/oxoprolinase/acetone carboxylase beta subunit
MNAEVADAVRAALPDVAVSVSSEILPEIKEYPRTSTTVINAYVQPVVRAYITALDARLRALGIDAPLQLMQSNGGLASATFAAAAPAHIIESGPAAGVVGGAALARRLNEAGHHHFRHGRHHREGRSRRTRRGHPNRSDRSWRRRHGRVPVAGRRGLYAQVARHRSRRGRCRRRIDLPSGRRRRAQGRTKSAGADPGPVCYGRGGVSPTITDCNLVLGYLDPGGLVGGA